MELVPAATVLTRFVRDNCHLSLKITYGIFNANFQESESGNWHIPTTTGDDLETPRQWICITRDNTNTAVSATAAPITSNTDKMEGPPAPPIRKRSQIRL